MWKWLVLSRFWVLFRKLHYLYILTWTCWRWDGITNPSKALTFVRSLQFAYLQSDATQFWIGLCTLSIDIATISPSAQLGTSPIISSLLRGQASRKGRGISGSAEFLEALSRPGRWMLILWYDMLCIIIYNVALHYIILCIFILYYVILYCIQYHIILYYKLYCIL